MKSQMIKFSIWIVLVCAWNFGVPGAEPIYADIPHISL